MGINFLTIAMDSEDVGVDAEVYRAVVHRAYRNWSLAATVGAVYERVNELMNETVVAVSHRAGFLGINEIRAVGRLQ